MAVCRACGEPIEFHLTSNGRWRPYNLDGSVHFATCRAPHVYDVSRLRRWLREHAPAGSQDSEDASKGESCRP